MRKVLLGRKEIIARKTAKAVGTKYWNLLRLGLLAEKAWQRIYFLSIFSVKDFKI